MTNVSPNPILDDDVQNEVTLTVPIRENMLGTAKWTMWVGGIFIILNVVGLLGSIVLLIGSFIDDIEEDGILIFSLVALVVVGLSFYLSLELYRYGAQLKRLAAGEELDALSIFLQKQRNLWRTIGILISFALTAYGILIFYITITM